MIRKVTLITGFFWFSTMLLAQADNDDLNDLMFYADVMINADHSEHRVRAHDEFTLRFEEILESPGSASISFDSLRWVQKLISADSSLRIFTWELRVTDDEFLYTGVVQIGRGEEGGQLVWLEQRRNLGSEFAQYDNETWYGALYYGLHEFTDSGGNRKYMLLGFNANDSRTNKKVTDVMSLQNGRVIFGSDDFQSDEGSKSRIVIEYSDGATGRMQFDREQNKLIYDHVVTIPGGPEGVLYVPDGSYHGYEYKEGKWYFIDKVFNTVVDQPPGDGIEKTGEELDLFGRPRKD